MARNQGRDFTFLVVGRRGKTRMCHLLLRNGAAHDEIATCSASGDA